MNHHDREMTVDRVFNLINESLTSEEKVELVTRLSKDAGLSVEQVIYLIHDLLEPEERVELVTTLLGRKSGLSVVWGSQNTNVGTNVHINITSQEHAADMIEKIAHLMYPNGYPNAGDSSKG